MSVMKAAGGVLITVSLLVAVACSTTDTRNGSSLSASASPKYRMEPFWPKALHEQLDPGAGRMGRGRQQGSRVDHPPARARSSNRR